MRRIAIMIGSDSDLPQCLAGLAYLEGEERRGNVNVFAVWTNSVHRHMTTTFEHAECGDADVIIAGAGKAAHLPGMVDSYLRYERKNTKTVIIGVAFKGSTERATEAAVLSIAEVPGTQVVFKEEWVGSDGFLKACVFASRETLPTIKLKEPPPPQTRMLHESIEASIEKLAEKGV